MYRRTSSSYLCCKSMLFHYLQSVLLQLLGGCFHWHIVGIVRRAYACVLSFAYIVINQQVNHLRMRWQGSKKLCRCHEIGVVGIHSVYQRDTNPERVSEFAYHSYVGENQIIVHNGVSLVSLTVHHLQVYQHQFASFGNTSHCLWRCQQGRVHHSVKASFS